MACKETVAFLITLLQCQFEPPISYHCMTLSGVGGIRGISLFITGTWGKMSSG